MHVSTNVKYLLRNQGAWMVACIRINKNTFWLITKGLERKLFVHGVLIYRYVCNVYFKSRNGVPKYLSLYIALDRSAWRLAINVPEPWTYFFQVSSLAYPNLLGKKGYVVVVVVIQHTGLMFNLLINNMLIYRCKKGTGCCLSCPSCRMWRRRP